MASVDPDTRTAAVAGAPLDLLAREAAGGDRRASHALVEQLLPRVRNLVRYLVRGDRDVDDISQDALVAVLRGLATYRHEGAFTAWADRVTARTTFAAIRARRRDEAISVVDVEPHVDERAIGADEYLARRRAVQSLDVLPNEQRHAVVLHHVVGMSVPEIAAELAISADTVKSRIRLGVARLRDVHRRDESEVR